MNADIPEDQESLLQTLRVLYVEDDADTRQEQARFLKKRVGYLAAAVNGADALELTRAMDFDAVITDLRMPDMDGIAFVRAMREAGAQTPVIITSAFSDSDTILQTVDLGIVKYCVKPINTGDLLATLERIAAEAVCRRRRSAMASSPLDRERRLACEKSLRSETAHLLKTLTGKGPRDVQVIVSAETLDLCITDAFTPLELSVLKNPTNAGLVISLRRLLYTEAQETLETLISAVWGVPVALTDIRSDVQTHTDRLVFKY